MISRMEHVANLEIVYAVRAFTKLRIFASLQLYK